MWHTMNIQWSTYNSLLAKVYLQWKFSFNRNGHHMNQMNIGPGIKHPQVENSSYCEQFKCCIVGCSREDRKYGTYYVSHGLKVIILGRVQFCNVIGQSTNSSVNGTED